MVHVVLPNILQVLLYSPDLSQINPLERSMDHIVDEDAEDQDGRTDGHDGIVIGPIPFDGQAGEGEAQERAAGVSQEDCRRRSEEHTSELQSLAYLVCRLLLEKKKTT